MKLSYELFPLVGDDLLRWSPSSDRLEQSLRDGPCLGVRNRVDFGPLGEEVLHHDGVGVASGHLGKGADKVEAYLLPWLGRSDRL